MNRAGVDMIDSSSLAVRGDLTFYTAQKLLQESQRFIQNLDHVHVNLTRVNHCDSAGLAFLIELKRFAEQNNIRMDFQSLPEQLTALAQVSRIDGMLS